MKKISCIVPCYNEEESLPLFYEEITGVLKDFSYELIFVDDGSKDGTLSYIKNLREKDPKVFYISFSRNFGKEGALLAGMEQATGDYVAFLDADLQHPPKYLPKMVQTLESEDLDIVGLQRVTRKGEPKLRSFFANTFYTLFNSVSDTKLKNGATDFCLMKKQVADSILSLPETNRFSKGIFAWVGYKSKWLEYENVERAKGSTKWSFKKLLKYSINGFTGFTTFPLEILVYVGLLFFLFSFIFFLISWGKGNPLLPSALFLFSSVQLIAIGILGQYLGKIYTEIQNRPKYLIREKEVPFTYTTVYSSTIIKENTNC